jgi:hypothetical protein
MFFARVGGGPSDPRAARNGDILILKGLSFFGSRGGGVYTVFLTASRQEVETGPTAMQA